MNEWGAPSQPTDAHLAAPTRGTGSQPTRDSSAASYTTPADATAPATTEIQRRWLADDRDAVTRITKALTDSGYDPPDTDLLAWGSVMGIDEVGLRSTLAQVLEHAVENGTFMPGRSGWRRTQTKLAEAWLTTPPLAHSGRTPVEVIHTERRATWLRERHPQSHHTGNRDTP